MLMIFTSGGDGLHLLKHLTELQQVCPVSGLGLGRVALAVHWLVLQVTGGGAGGQPRPLHLLGGRGPHLLRPPGRESWQGAV